MEIPLDIPYDHPQYTVGEKAATSRLGKLEDKVDSITVNGMQIGGTESGNGGGVYVIGLNDTTPETDSNVYSARRIRNNFLSKTKDDVAQGIIRFVKGLNFGAKAADNHLGISSAGIATLTEIVSQIYKSGAFGSGFKLGLYNDGGDSYLEVDRLLVRKAAEFVRLVIRELQSVGGEIVLSPAAMKISKVDFLKKGTLLPEYGTAPLRYDVYRCSFLTKRGDEEITNPFVVNDLVRCQTFNIKEGTTANAKNKYYWRRVTAVGTDYIDILALSGGNYGDSQPEVGDELVQMGNTTDAARQSVLYLSAYGSDSPSIKLYKGVNDYTLDGKEIFVVSSDEVYALASMFKLKVKDGSTTKEMTLAELVLNVDGLTSTVAANKQEVDGQIGKINTTLSQNAESISSLAQKQTNTENKVSKIEQTTDKISLQVETTTNLKNSIVGSAFRKWDSCTTNNSNYPVTFHNGGVGGSRFLRISSVGASANTWAGISLDCAGMKANTRYTCSVWFRTRTKPDSEVYMRVSGKSSASGTFSIYSTQWFTPTGKTDEWTLYKWSFTTPASVYAVKVDLVVLKNGTIHLCRPMIMEGTEYGGWSLSPYDKTEAGKLESGLKRTGVDIENGKITATADKFEVRNNSGEVTASVNEKGLLEVGDGVFSGLIRKKMTEITPENLKEYVTDVPALALGNIQIDFEKTGCFVMFSGNIKAMFNTDIVIVPPFYMPQEQYWGSLSTKTVYEALAYIGQTIIVVNNSDAEMTLIGYTQLDFPTQDKYFVRGYGAIVTCYLTGSKYCRISWNGSVRRFFDTKNEQSDATTEQPAEPTADDPTTTEEEQPKE